MRTPLPLLLPIMLGVGHAQYVPGSLNQLNTTLQIEHRPLNIIHNGLIDRGNPDLGWGWDPVMSEPDAGAALVADDARAASLRRSLRVSQPVAAADARWTQRISAPEAGTRWRLTAKMSGTLDPDSAAYVRCEFIGADAPPVEARAEVLDDEWMTPHAEATIPEGATALLISVGIRGTGEAWFDDMTLSPLDEAIQRAEETELLIPVPPSCRTQAHLGTTFATVMPANTLITAQVERTDWGGEVIRVRLKRETYLAVVSLLHIVLQPAFREPPPSLDTPITPPPDLPEDVRPYASTAYLAVPEHPRARDDLRRARAARTCADLAALCAELVPQRTAADADDAARWRDREGAALDELALTAALWRVRGVPARIVTRTRTLPAERTIRPVYERRVEVYLPGYGWTGVAPDDGDERWTLLGVCPPGLEMNPPPSLEARVVVRVGGKVVAAPFLEPPFRTNVSWVSLPPQGPPLSVADLAALAEPIAAWRERHAAEPVAREGHPSEAFQSVTQDLASATTFGHVRRAFGDSPAVPDVDDTEYVLGSACWLQWSVRLGRPPFSIIHRGTVEPGVRRFGFGWDPVMADPDAGATLAMAEDRATSGRFSLRVAQPVAEADARWTQRISAPEAGTRWRLDARVSGTLNPGSAAYVRCEFIGADAPPVEARAEVLDDDWMTPHAEATIPEGATALLISLGIEGTGEAWFDDISMSPADAALLAAREVEVTMPIPPTCRAQVRVDTNIPAYPPMPRDANITGEIEETGWGEELLRLRARLPRTDPLTITCSHLMLLAATREPPPPMDSPISPLADLPEDVRAYADTAYLAVPEHPQAQDDLGRAQAAQTCADLEGLCAELVPQRTAPDADDAARWRDREGAALDELALTAALWRAGGVPARVVTRARALPLGDGPLLYDKRVEAYIPPGGWAVVGPGAPDGADERWGLLAVCPPGLETAPPPWAEGRAVVRLGETVVAVPFLESLLRSHSRVIFGPPVGPPLSEADLAALVEPIAAWRERFPGELRPGGSGPRVGLTLGAIWVAMDAAQVREVFEE